MTARHARFVEEYLIDLRARLISSYPAASARALAGARAMLRFIKG
jgi:hypothetical protein